MAAPKLANESLEFRLEKLCKDTHDLMQTSGGDPYLLKAVLTKLNCVYAELERVVIQEFDSSKKKFLTESLQLHHVRKAKFDERATKWLKESEVTVKEIRSVMTGARSLRSRRFQSGTSSSIKFNLSMTKVIAK